MKNFSSKIGFSLILTGIVFFCGCAKLTHMQELLRLKEYSDEKTRQKDFVQEQDQNFEKLLSIVRDDGMGRYADQNAILKDFGGPVIRKDIVKDQKPIEVWLYRYTTKFFGSDKVYLYFDTTGRLDSYDYCPATAQ